MSDTTKTTIRINAKSFIEDLRAGLTDEELMLTYELDPTALDKLFRKLLAKNLITEEELDRDTQPTMGRAFVPPQETPQEYSDIEETAPLPIVEEQPKKELPKDPTKCPNCSATVGKKALICPECGHVLSGAQRWEDVETKRPLLERIPPLLLGIIIAIPFAIVAFYFLVHMLLPATEADLDKKVLRYQQKRSATVVPKNVTPTEQETALQSVLDELYTRKIIQSYTDDLSEIQTGPGWDELTNDERKAYLTRLSRSMLKTQSSVDVIVIDDEGYTVAKVVGSSVEILEADFQSVMESEQEEQPETVDRNRTAPELPGTTILQPIEPSTGTSPEKKHLEPEIRK